MSDPKRIHVRMVYSTELIKHTWSSKHQFSSLPTFSEFYSRIQQYLNSCVIFHTYSPGVNQLWILSPGCFGCVPYLTISTKYNENLYE